MEGIDRIAENYVRLKENIASTALKSDRQPSDITLVAVSKTHPWEQVQPVYQEGCRDFGESRLQEYLQKVPQAPSDVQWHFIGSLQKNKVKRAIGEFALIHSVDSLELAKMINLCSQEAHVCTPILLQVNTSGEASKHGLSSEEWHKAFEEVSALPALSVQGLMTMAPFTSNERAIHSCFSRLREFRDKLQLLAGDKDKLHHLSMGMSHDYVIAIQEGATILRVGSAIFG